MKFAGVRAVSVWLGLQLLAGAVCAESTQDFSETPFEQLVQRDVVPASKLAQQVSDSPSAVAIVTAEDIRAYGYRTIADVLNSMRGLNTTHDYRYEYMGGRSFGEPGDYAGRIMLMIDGYATQDSLFNQAYVDHSGLIDLDLVERVEYVPGTGSVTYGSNAMLGIVNIVTRQGRAFNGTQVAGEVFSHGGKKERLTYGKRFENGADVLFSVSALDTNGRNRYFPAYDTPATNNGIAEARDWERNKRLFGKFSYEGLTVEAAYVDRNKAVPTNPSYYAAFNSLFAIRDENAFLNGRYETDLGLSLYSSTRFYYGQYTYDAFREFADDSDGEKYGQRRFDGKWWGLDQKFVGNWFKDHALVFGFEYRNDYRQSFNWRYLSAAHETVRTVQEDYARRTFSLYLADEIRLSDRWSLNLGVRYDDAGDLAANWSPRLAAIYRPTVETTWKVSYSEAFRMPNANDRSTYGAMAAPEYVAATELVLQHEFSPRMRFTGSLYRYKRSRQLAYSPVADDYVPEGSSTSRGLEVELERSWESGIRVRGSMAWQHASDVRGAQLANSPHVLGKLNLTFPIIVDQWRVGLEGQYLGSRLALLQEEMAGTVPDQKRLGAVALANLTLSSERKWYGLSASFSIRNLFDRRYEVVSPFDWRPASDIPQDTLRMDGRTYWFQLRYDF